MTLIRNFAVSFRMAVTWTTSACPFPGKKEAKDGMARTKDIFAGGKMNLHKTRMTGDFIPEASVLGLVWDTVTDKLAVTVPQSSCPTTKSGLLSMVAKTFDPLGMLVPVVDWRQGPLPKNHGRTCQTLAGTTLSTNFAERC